MEAKGINESMKRKELEKELQCREAEVNMGFCISLENSSDPIIERGLHFSYLQPFRKVIGWFIKRDNVINRVSQTRHFFLSSQERLELEIKLGTIILLT